jgi:O-antigen ligase
VLVLPLPTRRKSRLQAAMPAPEPTGGIPVRTLITLVLALVAAYAANSTFRYAATHGLFDESMAAKFQTQSQGDYGVLFGGRPETLVAIQAIIDSPIIGHGSFAYGEKYVELKQDIMYEHGYSDNDDPEVLFYPTIPTHSHLTLAWVEGGILGGVCWIYIFVLTLRAILRLSSTRPALAPLYCYLLAGFLWDILYSPFGSVNRMLGAYAILVSYHLLRDPVKKALPVYRGRFGKVQTRRLIRPIAARGM